MKAKREAFVQAVLSKGDNLSDEEFARLMKNYTNDVNDLNARLEEDRKKWKNQLREKLEKLASSNNKNGLGVDNSNSRPASARSLSGRNDGEGEPKEVREAWLAEEEKLQVSYDIILLFMHCILLHNSTQRIATQHNTTLRNAIRRNVTQNNTMRRDITRLDSFQHDTMR